LKQNVSLLKLNKSFSVFFNLYFESAYVEMKLTQNLIRTAARKTPMLCTRSPTTCIIAARTL